MIFIRDFFSGLHLYQAGSTCKRAGAGLLLFLFCIGGYAQQNVQMPVTLSVKSGALKEVFKLLEQKTGFSINYQDDVIDAVQKVTLDVREKPFSAVLHQLLKNTPATFRQQGSMIMLIKKTATQTTVPKKDPGKITGRIIDEENGLPVAGATVMIGDKAVVSDVAGSFTVMLPKGSYTATVSYVGYDIKEISGIDVKDNQTFSLNVTLKRKKGHLAEVVVRSSVSKESLASLYARQKNNPALSDGISAEQISRTPDNTVAQALKRVSGLTVQDNKFVIVRGMGERYNNVLLNGSSLPSTEPNRRNFSFDIIPSNLINNVVVNKTATPDMPGEFTGGLVQVNTIDIPRENFIQLSAGTGFNNNSTGKKFLSTRRLGSDYLGAPGKSRQWLNRSWNSRLYKQMIDNNDVAGMNAMNAGIPNNYGLYQYTADPTQQYQLSLGGSKQLNKGRTLGLVMAGTYRHEENIETYDAWFRASPTIVNDGHEYIFTTAVGAIGNIAYQSPKNKIALRNIFNRRFQHSNIVQDAEDKSRAGISSEYISTVESGDLFQARLEGEHQLTARGLKFNWFADMANVTKEQPDTRYSVAEVRGVDPETGQPLRVFDYSRPQSSTIKDGGLFAYNLKERKQNIGGDFLFPFLFSNRSQKIKAGYWGTFRTSEYQQVSLAPTAEISDKRIDSIGYGKEDYQIFTPENFAAGFLTYRPLSTDALDAADYYKGDQQLHATYLMLDLMPLKKLRLITGIRYENNRMKVHTTTRVNAHANATDSTVQYVEDDLLPSVNLIYSLTPKINIRAAYSKTLARPDFRERSSFKYYDIRLRQVIKGIHGLEYSRAENIDLRFEWYPSPVEIISITAFHKKYRKPVETVSHRYPDNRYGLFYFNLEDAMNQGIELDYRHSFSFINKKAAFWKNLFLNASFSWMDSRIRYYDSKLNAAAQGQPLPEPGPEKATRNRPLQGLSPYIINAGLSYQGSRFGLNVTYNRFGRRVLFAGIDDHDDIYENPRDVIDLQLSGRLLKQRLEIRFNVSDLLNQYYIDYFNMLPPGNPPPTYSVTPNKDDPKGLGYNAASDWTMKRTRKGASFALILSYRL